MLLAGIRETVLDAGPIALTNVVRAALGQIEGFQRVQLLARTEVAVAPDIIGDLTLMVAELVENAVSFSPADSPVEVFVQNSAEGAAIVVADHGLGMDPERLDEENARIVRRERLDLVPSKVLGLFVVGSLARRWDIDVALSRTPGGGVTAEVTLPQSLLLTAAAVRPAAPTTPAAATDDTGPRPPVPAGEHDGPLPAGCAARRTRPLPRTACPSSPRPAPRNRHPPTTLPAPPARCAAACAEPPCAPRPTPPPRAPARHPAPPTRRPSAAPSRSSRPRWNAPTATATRNRTRPPASTT